MPQGSVSKMTKAILIATIEILTAFCFFDSKGEQRDIEDFEKHSKERRKGRPGPPPFTEESAQDPEKANSDNAEDVERIVFIAEDFAY